MAMTWPVANKPIAAAVHTRAFRAVAEKRRTKVMSHSGSNELSKG